MLYPGNMSTIVPLADRNHYGQIRARSHRQRGVQLTLVLCLRRWPQSIKKNAKAPTKTPIAAITTGVSAVKLDGVAGAMAPPPPTSASLMSFKAVFMTVLDEPGVKLDVSPQLPTAATTICRLGMMITTSPPQ